MLRLFSWFFGLLSLGLIAVCGLALGIYWYYGKDLPNYQQLAEYKPLVVSRVYSSNGRLIGEFAKENRLFTPIEDIPVKVKNAFVAAEDKNFYNHPGIDLKGIIRAALENVDKFRENKRLHGASTITQQVMKNFLLTNEGSLERKFKEIILSIRFEKAFTKEDILELYLNEIYLGAGSYGVTAAAQEYFGKELDHLTNEEIAYLAALPKAPSNYNPLLHYNKAVERRNYVLERMAEDKYITQKEYETAVLKPIKTILGKRKNKFDTSYFVEEVRRNMVLKYGEKSVYTGGLSIMTTVDPKIQTMAERALREGIWNFERRTGYRGAITNVPDKNDWESVLHSFNVPTDLYMWDVAIITNLEADKAAITTKRGKEGTIAIADLSWARPNVNGHIGAVPRQTTDIMKIGDIIYVEQDREDASRYYLRQKPKINGAIAVIAPHTGHVLAMQGGYSFGFSEFNRATQALRQPGSSFKPFIYAAALSMGYSPATLINDSPMSIHIPGQKVWTPVNYDKTFMGNITMRVALEKSRNVPTIRLAQDVGMKKVSQIAKDFGIDEKLAHYYPLALGAGETTLMRMVNAYAMIANGGKAIQPVYITQVQDRYGKVLMKDDMRECKDCNNVDWKNQDFPVPADNRKVVLDEVSTYQLTSMLQGVVQRGTATILKSLNAPIAGKTGTTNDAKDVWFIGFTSDLAVGCYLGYDEPKSLGVKQTGGGLAAPIVKAFLTDALPITRHDPFPVPKNIELVKVNRKNGMPTNGESEDTVTEAFQPGTAPVETQKWYNNVNEPTTPSNDYYMPPKKVDETIMQGTGGLY